MNARDTGRWIGAAILATFFVGVMSNFKLQTDLFAGEGLLVNAAAHPLKIGLIAVSNTFTDVLSVAVAAMLYAFVGRTQPMLTIAYCIFVAMGLALGVVESATFFAFRTVSEAFAAAGAPPDVAWQVAKKILSGLRNGVHFIHMALGGFGVLTLFALFHRARLVPRAIALAGMVAAVAQMIAVARPLFGLEVIYPLLAPLGLAYVGTALWLAVKGMPEQAPRT